MNYDLWHLVFLIFSFLRTYYEITYDFKTNTSVYSIFCSEYECPRGETETRFPSLLIAVLIKSRVKEHLDHKPYFFSIRYSETLE